MSAKSANKAVPCPGTRAYEYRHSAQYKLDKRKAVFAEARLTEKQYLALDNSGLQTVEDWLWAFKELGLLKGAR